MLVCQLSPHNLYVTREKDLPSGKGVYNPVVTKPTIIYHADWGSKPSKRWCAKATLHEGRDSAQKIVIKALAVAFQACWSLVVT